MKKKIFSFWEPRAKIPGYLKLCIETWKKFLPDYEINILDHEKVREYLGEDLFSKIICKTMSYKVQADAIRVALLKKYGGIWLDIDTIILNGNFIKKLREFELVMIGDKRNKYHYIGFILASNNSNILDEWLKQIIDRVDKYKDIMKNKNITINSMKRLKSPGYLGNSIIEPILRNSNSKKFFCIDQREIKAFPERIFFKNLSLDNFQKYRIYYFEEGDPEILLEHIKHLVLLHNSWTPFKYKNMLLNKQRIQQIM